MTKTHFELLNDVIVAMFLVASRVAFVLYVVFNTTKCTFKSAFLCTFFSFFFPPICSHLIPTWTLWPRQLKWKWQIAKTLRPKQTLTHSFGVNGIKKRVAQKVPHYLVSWTEVEETAALYTSRKRSSFVWFSSLSRCFSENWKFSTSFRLSKGSVLDYKDADRLARVYVHRGQIMDFRRRIYLQILLT